ncbi:MAG TPA: sugar transferase, partial [Candidatus Didemnitutus sp.]|nr:sugar transferase [Candidatus Didemnitutus sp.]
ELKPDSSATRRGPMVGTNAANSSWLHVIRRHSKNVSAAPRPQSVVPRFLSLMKSPAPATLNRKPRRPGIDVMPTWKRSLDIFCAVLALPALALGVLAMTVVNRLFAPGPVFFRQERVGFRGRRFKILKFRTMVVNADTTIHQRHFKELIGSNAPMAKLDTQRDARLIPGGWLLRASGLDELPQLINVLAGDMSLVGPRPCLPGEHDQFQPAQRDRVNVVPGLTGLWQVSGKNRLTFEEMMRLDIRYAGRVSFMLDLKIILLTPWALLVQIHDVHLCRGISVPVAPSGASRPSLSSGAWGKPWRPGFAGPRGLLLTTAYTTGPDETRRQSENIDSLKP